MKPWADDIRHHIQTWSDRLGPLSWWPRYVYHFTDVNNAVQIIQSRYLYCRTEVEHQNLMAVDNASPTIIQQTHPEHLNYVRLYFRPRTPTQYRNEGLRPIGQRQLDGAHCPVPIYFCFDSFTVLSADETRFSNGNIGSPRAIHSAERDFFFNIPFQLVFHDEWVSPQERDEIIFRRNAEVLVPDRLALEPALKFIACRSVAERQTLLHLLPIGLASRWAPRIRLGELGLFYRRWTYLEEVVTVDNRVIFRFNPNTETAGPFQVRFSYQEQGAETVRIWEGQKDRLDSKLSFQLAEARWGIATLHLDDSLAFAGLLLFEEIPF
ncbi:MAG: DUF4433 domain-containing protein [Anaerolineales bacterium]|nr:DUF4433 domain-containing protein [Anaerolineales bacterium]